MSVPPSPVTPEIIISNKLVFILNHSVDSEFHPTLAQTSTIMQISIELIQEANRTIINMYTHQKLVVCLQKSLKYTFKTSI